MDFMLNDNIVIVEGHRKRHLKASEEYLHVEFHYPGNSWDGWVPVVYRRTGVSIKPDQTDRIIAYLNLVYEQMNPIHFPAWQKEQERFWREEKPNAGVTKAFFDSLVKGGWQCVECTLPKNPNWARRIQDLKEFGYTISTDTKRLCPNCGKNRTHLMLLPIKRGNAEGNGYEAWSPALRKRIIRVLGGMDVYEGTVSAHCLPDHKFSEIRWDEATKEENPDSMTDQEIKEKFQLLTNQRNQQKREACRTCFQTGKRGSIYGIPFYFVGNENWDAAIPEKGKDAEKGCIGCPWHDIAEWKRQLLMRLNREEKAPVSCREERRGNEDGGVFPKTVGSICSGIEAASVAWEPLGLKFEWFSEIADFPSLVLAQKYPGVENLGDMCRIPDKIEAGEISAPDLLCGGTPCQAFSLAGWKNGLQDDRGNLTLKFVDIVNANDKMRIGKQPSVVFWENVEGVLTDKTNAFGCFVCSLAGCSDVIEMRRWPNAGVIHGPKRNVAWRVLDAKFFGLPQQRRRLYLLAGGKDFYPENVLLELHTHDLKEFPSANLVFEKDGHTFEVFRSYTDCLYSAYGTKWNGNAAAYNGSLYVVQDGRIRRLSPLEGERLMGFPDNYTDLPNAKRTNRYQAIGNSWAVPVVRWIGERLSEYDGDCLKLEEKRELLRARVTELSGEGFFWDFGKDIVEVGAEYTLNCTPTPEVCEFRDMSAIVSKDAPEEIYISPVGCYGIVRRKRERNLKINQRLEEVLLSISAQMSAEEIERQSRIQKRGRPGSLSDAEADQLTLKDL